MNFNSNNSNYIIQITTINKYNKMVKPYNWKK